MSLNKYITYGDFLYFAIIIREVIFMKNTIESVIVGIIVVTLTVLCLVLNPISLSTTQLETLLILGIVCGASALYCFVVGEISRNNSQMDKLWSILPIAYTWIIAGKSGMNPRQVIYAILVTLWGIRLTINFARKGAYRLKFWSGEEDYRWKILREKKQLKNRFVWAMFDLFFISIYQNALVLAICFPSLASMDSTVTIGLFDYIAFAGALIFLLIELAADEQQMFFHTTKRRMLNEGKKLEELPEPFNKGFNTLGLWSYSRHPNHLGEQGFWLLLSLVTIGAGVTSYYAFSWSMAGPLILILLFLGSSTFQEAISSKKYPEYQNYLSKVSKYIPFRKYRP